MTFTGYFRYPTGSTLYVKPLPLNNSPWSTGVIVGIENGTLGSYAFALLTEGVEYEVFRRAGGSPASSDLAVGQISKNADSGTVNITTNTTVIESE